MKQVSTDVFAFFLVASFLGLCPPEALGAGRGKGGAHKNAAKACQKAILELAKKGPGGDWVYEADLFALMTRQGLQKLRYGAVYQCPFCNLYNPSKGVDGQFATCEGCTKSFDATDGVNEVVDVQGRRIVHVRSIYLPDNRAYKPMEAPWVCPSCQLTNDYYNTTCQTADCGTTRAEGSRQVVEFGEGRVVVETDNRLDGYVVETPEEAEEWVADSGRRRTGSDEALPGGQPENQAPVSSQSAPRMNRRQLMAIGSIGAIGAASVIYGLQDPAPPKLEKTETVRGRIDSVYWERRVDVTRRENGRWIHHARYFDFGDETQADTVLSQVPPEFFTDYRQYRVEVSSYHSVLVDLGRRAGVVERPVSEQWFRQWRAGDPVEVGVAGGGELVFLRRVRE